ncbi:hypothetical protein COLO4_29017 [Corchorus olitorius]|uniref:Uncharacterized protein n=1 Tax=Corchorus olitorius TaxID=93759 RepID=A0A1R3HGW3_9ROSI|nr:hypothetical protein COLO4_29017 [Corchorus olitorius]
MAKRMNLLEMEWIRWHHLRLMDVTVVSNVDYGCES